MPALRKSPLGKIFWPAYIVLLFLTAGSTLVVEVGAHAGHRHIEEPLPVVVAADVHCSKIRQTITVSVSQTAFKPSTVKARLCDEVVFRNATTSVIEVSMGSHDQHLAYPGLGEAVLGPDQDKHLVLVTAGTFPLHEHLKDVAKGILTVTR